MTIMTLLPLSLLAIPCLFAVGVVLATIFQALFSARTAASVAVPRAQHVRASNHRVVGDDDAAQIFARRAFAR